MPPKGRKLKPKPTKDPLSSEKLESYKKFQRDLYTTYDACKKEMSRLEVEWLYLCSKVKKPVDPKESIASLKQTAPLFKDAEELNAIPIKIENSVSDLENNYIQSDVEHDED